MRIINKLWIGIGVLIILSPLGLLLPEHFKAGGAWGEDKLLSLWSAPFPDYVFKGWKGKPIASLSFAYILSAVIGALVCVIVVLILAKLLSKKK